jgi:hypothetical protein
MEQTQVVEFFAGVAGAAPGRRYAGRLAGVAHHAIFRPEEDGGQGVALQQAGQGLPGRRRERVKMGLAGERRMPKAGDGGAPIGLAGLAALAQSEAGDYGAQMACGQARQQEREGGRWVYIAH